MTRDQEIVFAPMEELAAWIKAQDARPRPSRALYVAAVDGRLTVERRRRTGQLATEAWLHGVKD